MAHNTAMNISAQKILIFLLVVLILVEVGVLLSPILKGKSYTLQAYAQSVIETCKDEKYRPTCYEREIPDLLSVISIEEVFDVLRLVQEKDSSYRFCHVLAHEVGERETAKDPSLWFDVIPRCPTDGLCSNGCIHGATVERFSKEVLSDEEIELAIPDLAIACEPRGDWNPSPLDQAICYHGLGHMGIHITKADIGKSLEICDLIARKEDGRNYEQVCDEGVYMQLFQPLEPEDFALIDELSMKPSAENLSEFCRNNSSSAAEEAACWREGWPFFREKLQSGGGIVEFCSHSPNEEQEENCYGTVLAVLGRTSLDNPEQAVRVCSELPAIRQGQCFSIAAVAVVEEGRKRGVEAVAFCKSAPSEELTGVCYDTLVSRASFVFHPTSPEFGAMCDALPQPWQERCFLQAQ